VLSLILIDSLNLDWAVRPEGKVDAATPELARGKAINPFEWTVATREQYKNVFPMPPWPSIKKDPCLFEKTLSTMTLYACFCLKFSLSIDKTSFLDTIIFSSSSISLNIAPLSFILISLSIRP